MGEVLQKVRENPRKKRRQAHFSLAFSAKKRSLAAVCQGNQTISLQPVRSRLPPETFIFDWRLTYVLQIGKFCPISVFPNLQLKIFLNTVYRMCANTSNKGIETNPALYHGKHTSSPTSSKILQQRG
jgi:hypothetical protein